MSKKVRLDKAAYRQACATHPTLPIFFQDWWLDLVCDDGYWDALVYVEDPHVVAVFPFFVKTFGPWKYVTMPRLTKFLGPYYLKEFSERKQHSILMKMVEAIPDFLSVDLNLHYQNKNWLPFRWKGYRQTAMYSFVLEDISDIEAVYQGMDGSYRTRIIKKASTALQIRRGLPLDHLTHLLATPFVRRKMKLPLSKSLVSKLDAKLSEREQGIAIAAEDENGRSIAVAWLVWDSTTCYLLATGEDVDQRQRAAGIYTIWQGIKFASEELGCRRFDFLGSVLPEVVKSRRHFGAQPQMYSYVRKAGVWLDVLRDAKRALTR